MKAQHINITVPVALKTRIDAESRRESIGRSTLIQKAVTFYLDILKRKRVRALLREGYAEMAGESRKITEEFKGLDDEALKYVG